MQVETPGWYTFANVLFDRMHYGPQSDVTALCLLLLLVIVAGSGVVLIVKRILPFAFAAQPARRAQHSVPRLR
jgi:hypothetical protein